MVNVLSPIAYDESLSGDIEAKLTVTDQYSNEDHVNVKFPETKSPECNNSLEWDDGILHCDQLSGHSGPHRTQDRRADGVRVATKWGWDLNLSPQSYVVS
jgi:hypothetical protein